ncbi:MAG: pyridoxamine 5'-phosphate oxidase family protein [Bacillota bacterium]
MKGIIRRAARAADREQAEEILRTATVGHLATTYADGTPYVVTVNYGWSGGRVYFHGAPRGDKLDNIERDPRVCFAVDIDEGLIRADRPCDAGVAFRSVVIFGRARLVEEPAEKLAALTAVARQVGQGGQVSLREAERTAVVAIEPEVITAKVRGRD